MLINTFLHKKFELKLNLVKRGVLKQINKMRLRKLLY